jgi:hypothetical protein
VKRIFPAINAVIAISVGIVVLLGYFIPLINPFRFIFLQWAVILAGIAVLIGVWNLFSVHMQKIRIRQSGSLNSLVLIFFMLLTMIFSLVPDMQPLQKVMLDGIMIPAEISLVAVLAVTLLYASVRLLRVRPNWTSILFLAITLIILLGLGPLPYLGQIPYLSNQIRPFVSDALAIGGARGILIGVALGTLTTGLRILLGADRPYGDS